MKQFVNKIAATCMAVLYMLTASINVRAYELWGNDTASEDGDAAKGILLNLVELAAVYDENIAILQLEHDLATGDYMGVIESLGDSAVESALGEYGIFYSTSKFCTQIFLDFFGSVYNVPGAYRDWYKSIKTLYSQTLSGIIESGKWAYTQGCNGITLSPELIKNRQAFVDSAHETADAIREDSNSFLFRKKKIQYFAEQMDNLANITDLSKLYNEGLVKYNASNRFSFYSETKDYSCDAAAVFHMICQYKSISTTQSKIMEVAKDNFWNNCEPYFGLNDGGSYVTLNGNGWDNLGKIKNCLRNTPAVIKISTKISPYYYTYVVGVFRGDALYILDPTANSDKGFTVREYGEIHGLREDEVYSRMLAAWSYC